MKTTLLTLCLLNSILLIAQPGILDPAFADNGIFSKSRADYDDIQEIISLPDGSYMAVGGSYVPAAEDYEGWLIHLDKDGNEILFKELDLYDGQGGEYVESIIYVEGSIYIGGLIWDSGFFQYRGFVAQIDMNGNLVSSFGENGIRSFNGDIYALTADPDGNIFAVGRTYSPNRQDERGIVVKIQSDGNFSSEYGKGGFTFINHLTQRTGALEAKVIKNNLYVTGWTQQLNGNFDGLIVKFDGNGNRVDNFGVNGSIITDEGTEDFSTSIYPYGSDMFLSQAEIGSNSNDVRIARYNLDGQLDATFGEKGYYLFDSGEDDDGNKIMVDENMNIYFCGSIYNEEDFSLVCLNADGSINEAFGNNGLFEMDFNKDDDISGMAIDQQGNIVLAGESDDSNSADMLIMKIFGIGYCNSISTFVNLEDCNSVNFNGEIYTQTTTATAQLTAQNGCDSIVTAQIQILESTEETISVSDCEMMMINGENYDQSGTYTQTLTNSSGCDSILTIMVNIKMPSNGLVMEAACEPVTINGELYSNSGTYSQLLTNSAGCDSILTVEFELLELEAEIELDGDELICVNEGLSYQWIDCSSAEIISDAKERTFKPTTSGDFAVIISDGICADTSECISIVISGLIDFQSASSDVILLPNPAHNHLTLKAISTHMIQEVFIYDLSGRLLFQYKSLNTNSLMVDISTLNQGVYFVKGRLNNGLRIAEKFIKME